MSISNHSEQRSAKRLALPLSAVVKIRESKDVIWNETTDLITVSRNGAGFYLQKQCQIGQLVSLMMPLPKHLRCYDREKGLYRVWGLVQHCYLLPLKDQPSYHVGVAFIGKSAPPEYNDNPAQSYRLCGMSKDGLWEIVEAQASFISRKHSRFWISIDVPWSFLSKKKTNLLSKKPQPKISVRAARPYSRI